MQKGLAAHGSHDIACKDPMMICSDEEGIKRLSCMHQLPVKSEEGVPDLFQLVPLKPGHLGVMSIPVVIAIAGLGILIACARQTTSWVPDLKSRPPSNRQKQQAEVQSSAP